MAQIVITPAAAAQIAALPLTVRARVLAVVERLKSWPDVSGAKRLTGEWAGHCRIRTGDYRVMFRVSSASDETSPATGAKKSRVPRHENADWVVTVVKVGHRSDIYED